MFVCIEMKGIVERCGCTDDSGAEAKLAMKPLFLSQASRLSTDHAEVNLGLIIFKYETHGLVQNALPSSRLASKC